MGWYESCLKPVIEVATFIGVVAALFYQESIIKSQRKEFERQRIKDNKQAFEQTFLFFYNKYKQDVEKLHKGKYLSHHSYTEFLSDYIPLPDLYEGIYEKINNSITNSKFQNRIDNLCKSELDVYVLLSSYLEFLLENVDTISVLDNNDEDILFKRKYLLQVFSGMDNDLLTITLCLFLSTKFNKGKALVIKYNLLENYALTDKLKKLVEKYKPLT